MGGGDDPDIHPERPGGAHLFDFALLNQAQQLHLEFHRQLADFVEKQRAAIGALHLAALGRKGAGERPLGVAEELRFHQVLGDGSAVNGYKRLVFAAAVVMDGARQQFLAGAGFAADQHRGIALRHAGGHFQHVEQHLRSTRDAFKSVLPIQAEAQAVHLLHQSAMLHGAVDHQHEFFVVDRLGDVVVGSGLHGGHGGLHGSKRGNHDHRRLRIQLANLLQQIHPGDAGHLQIGDQQRWNVLLHAPQRIIAVGGGGGGVASFLELQLGDAAKAFVVVHHKYGLRFHSAFRDQPATGPKT